MAQVRLVSIQPWYQTPQYKTLNGSTNGVFYNKVYIVSGVSAPIRGGQLTLFFWITEKKLYKLKSY